MSGIAGVVCFDDRHVPVSEVQRLTDRMVHRGPDGISWFAQSGIAFGHCLMRTTEEAADERQPLANDDGSVILVFDGWLQNWVELRARILSQGIRLKTRADSELVLRAYERWGHTCVDHIHGDFAFAVWNRRVRELFCARDRIGMRPFHYHRSRTHGFMFASDEGALLGHPHVPRTLDEGRIADAIFGELEAYDLTSTFHTEILRLPPAHTLIATGGRLTLARYWKHEPQPPLRLKSDEAYRDSFREVLNEAVSCRMRGGATTTFMVSGGLDSSSSAALARERLQTEGKLLQTVSAVSGDRDSCIETRCARAFGYLPGVSPRFAELDNLGPILPELVALYSAPLSPFDRHNALLRAVYLTARKNGARAVIDGVGGDLVLSDGGYLAYLLQNGRLTTAWREARAAYQFWGRGANAYQRLYGAAKSAFVPSWSRPWIRQIKRLTNNGREDWQGSLIDPAFAAGVCLDERLMQGRQQSGMTAPPGSSARRAGSVFRIHNVAARERYEREAARIGIEPRDPFLDVRVIEHCLTLPVELMVRSGWTKFILRDAMVDRLPDVIRWRKGRKHLGWDFTKTVVRTSKEMVAELFEKDCAAVTPYVRMEPVQQLLCDFRRGAGLQKQQEDDFYKISQLARFISTRPMSGEGC